MGLTKAHDFPEEDPKGPAEMRMMHLVTFRPWGQHFSVYLPQIYKLSPVSACVYSINIGIGQL